MLIRLDFSDVTGLSIYLVKKWKDQSSGLTLSPYCKIYFRQLLDLFNSILLRASILMLQDAELQNSMKTCVNVLLFGYICFALERSLELSHLGMDYNYEETIYFLDNYKI